MTETDFRECSFIDKQFRFYFYEDFIANCEFFRGLYNKYLSRNGKLFYKWYIYANIDMNIIQKNVIWDYLNGDCTKVELLDYRKKSKKEL